MSPDLMLELAWKSALIAGAALAGAALLGARPAAERVAVLRLGVVILLALPLLVALMPALPVQAPAFGRPPAEAVETTAVRRAPPVAVTSPAPRTRTPSTPPAAARPEGRIDPVMAALLFWAAGCAVLVLRLLAGVTLLHRWTRRAEPVSDARWLAALARAAQGRTPPVLRASPHVASPLSWGWRPAIILLDPAALDQAGRADAVLAHEMGHVRHGDWLFLMASRLLLALFWFNPLVWLLQRELARHSEQAADAWAAGRIGRADYASALVAMAGRSRPHAALGMAAPRGELARRVIAILYASAPGGKPWRAALAITACVGFATPLAAIELGAAALAPAMTPGPRSTTAPSRAESPVAAAAAIAAAMAPRAGRPDGSPAQPERLAIILRQRDQGLVLMEIGARTMEARAREMRIIAVGLDPDHRAALNADADGLVREAAALREEARDLAARDPATLRPMSPDDERELAEDLRQTLAEDLRQRVAEGPVKVPADVPDPVSLSINNDISLSLTNEIAIESDDSGAWRTFNGVQVDASGALRTPSGVHVDSSGEVLAPNGAGVDSAGEVRAPAGRDSAAGREQLRVGARQLRDGAFELDAGAGMAERSAAAAGDAARQAGTRARAAEMRARAADLRRQADIMEPGG